MEGLTIQTLYNIRGQNQNSKTLGYKIQKPSNFSSVFCTLTTLFIYLFICNLKKIKIKINGQNLSFVLKFNFPCARASLRLILLKQVSQSSSFVGSRITHVDAHVMRGTFDLSKW